MPAVEYVRPWLAPYQLAALFGPARYACVEATTKSGKTVGAMAWLTERAWLEGRPGRHYWWLAPIYAQAAIAFRRIRRGLPPGTFDANESGLTIALPTGATLWFKGAENPDGLYGEDVHGAVVDEASRVREEAWHALRSTLTATEGPVRLIGNVRGRRNWFYRLARRAQAGEAGMSYAKITAHDAVAAGVLSPGEVADAERQLPADVFRELYLAEPADDTGNPFGIAAIAACVGPLSDTDPVAFGVDLGKALDFTVVVGLDADGRVCRLARFQRSWLDTIRVVGDLTAGVPTLIDSTGLGDPVVEALQVGRRDASGFKFTQTSKQQLMEGLAVAIQRGQVAFPAGVLVAELEAFEYRYGRTGVTYGAPEGCHDDAVCALALALEQATRPQRRWVPL